MCAADYIRPPGPVKLPASEDPDMEGGLDHLPKGPSRDRAGLARSSASARLDVGHTEKRGTAPNNG